MSEAILKEIRPGDKPVKTALVKTLLFVMGRGIPAIARLDDDVRKEVEQWDESFSIMFEVLPNGPYLSLKKKDGELHFEGLHKTDADLVITFKNVDSAFMVFTTQLSTPEAYAQHRMSVKGDLSMSMSLIRCLNIVQFLLFPRILAKRIIRRLPELTPKRWGIRLYTYAVAVPMGV